jgi:hypothetical protein
MDAVCQAVRALQAHIFRLLVAGVCNTLAVFPGQYSHVSIYLSFLWLNNPKWVNKNECLDLYANLAHN